MKKALVALNALFLAFNGLFLVAQLNPAFAQNFTNHFSFTARSALPFPVATIRPVAGASVAALDVTPSAGAVPDLDNGYAWVDACDADILNANGNVPVTCARMGVKADRVEFGSRTFDGGAYKDVYIVRGRDVIARFHAGGLIVNGTITAHAFTQN